MAKDFLFKTIEFSKVERETPYMITRIRPIFSSEVYAEHPDEKFEYTSLEKMEAHLQQLLGYTSEQIALLPLESITSYYEPLYNIKWYIGGLFDFMHTTRFTSKSSSEVNELFVPLIDDSKIDTAQNELLGFTFPERMMELIRNKPINRMRMFVNAAKQTTETVSELAQYNNFSWITTNQFIPDGSGKTVGIKIKGTNDNDNLNTYQWVVFADTTNDAEVGTQFNPSHNRYIGISCNNKTNIVQVTKNSGETWPYSWAELPTSESDNSKLSYIFLGAYTYNCYIRYSNNKTTLNTNSFDSRGNFYQYIGICLSQTGLTVDHNIASNYIWRKITNFNNIIKYDVGDKRYYLYIRFVDKDNVLTDQMIPSKTIYIKLSYFNETNNKDNNHIYNDVSQYEGTISYNIFNKYTYNHLGTERVAWVKFADTLDASGSTGSNHLYDYAIYKDNESNTYKIRKYMYISINHKGGEEDPINLSNSKYYKIQLDNLTSEYAYSAQIVNENNQSSSYAIYVKFSNSVLPPTILENTQNNYSVNYTNYILVSITDENGQLHGNTTNNQNSTFDEYEIIVTAREQEIPTAFEKNRYAYFTYVDEIADPKKRSQYPITVVNGENKNKNYFGYSLVNRNQLSNSPRQIQKPDESSKEITLYRATGLNALTEANISKITSINIPYSTMGKFSVFNFDPIIINDNEYLIIGGNRDNTCVLTCDDSATFQWSEDGEHPDYTQKNTDNDPEHGERKIVTGNTSDDNNIMYYTGANFINNIEWSPVYDRYLPIDIGCGYAASSNEVQVTTKSFNDIIEETKINDAAALKAYQDQKQAESGHYKSPNYDLYVNLTYKFAKIIDGNIDYMPLYNRYKIKYKFKNENQVILEKKVFDTSVITPDGSIYNKPDHIELNGETYGKTTSTYINYFDYMEGEFTDTIKATDVAAEVKDNDYDVAYFQCNNILEQIYQTNYDDVTQGQQFDENYYNYKWLADGGNKDKLPVLCEITISAYDTATPLFTRIVPVTLAAYSLIEVTDDYIKSTVSKIENDYIYGLTQRTSRIEQYADRISMSVQNIGQGLYSRLQMTEDRILMEVVDASKQIGSAFNIYADKIQQMVYDVSNNMYSQILVEKQKISLEVSNNFRKAGIYLTDNSATIDAPNIVLRGDRTTIYNTLTIKQGQAEGIVMLDSSKADRIHITVDNIPDRDSLASAETNKYISFDTNNRQLLKGQTLTKDVINDILAHSKIETVNNRHAIISSISFYIYVDIPSLNISWLRIDNLISWKNVNPTLMVIEGERRYVDDTPSGSRNITNNDNEIVYGAAMPSATFKWEYNNRSLSKIQPETVYVYSNFTTHVFPEIHFSGINYSDIALSNDTLNSNLFTNIRLQEKNNNYATLDCTLSGTTGQVLVEASYSHTDENTQVYTDTCSFILEVATYTSSFGWYNDGELCGNNIQYIYYDDIQNSKLPYIQITGNDIRMIDITININFNGLTHFITAGNDGKLSFTSNTVGTIPQDTTKNIVVTATYTINSNDISQSVTIGIRSVGGGTYIDDIVEKETEWVYDQNTAQTFAIKLNDSGYYYKDNENINDIYFENPENNVAFAITTALNSIKNYASYFYDQHCADAEGWVHKYTDGYYYTQPATPSGGGSYMSMEEIDLSPNSTTNLITLVFKKQGNYGASFNAIRFIMNTDNGDEAANFLNISKIWIALSNDKNSHTTESEELIYDKSAIDKNNLAVFYDNNFNYVVFIKDSMNQTLYVNDSSPYIFIIIQLIPTSTHVYFDNIFLDYISDQYFYEFLFLWKHISYTDTADPWKSGLPGDGEIRANVSLSLDFNFTKGTRIGKNGIYSYTSDNTLFYMTTDLIEQRMENNGIRMAKWVSDSYAGSSALEVYYGGENETDNRYWWRWDNTHYWVSLFNYKPLLRFYATIKSSNTDSLNFHVPAQHKKFNWQTGKWINGEEKWVKEYRYDIIAEDDTGPYYWWDYDLSYHRGDISIEQVEDAGITHIITLPMSQNDEFWYRETRAVTMDGQTKYYKAGWDAVVKSRYGGYNTVNQPKIPVGFTINIMNSQYCSNDLNISGTTDKFTVGTPKARIVITTITQNCNFLKRRRAEDGTFKSWSKQGWNYGTENHHVYCNFLDAHGDYCSYIEMTRLNRTEYLTDIYHDNSFATFVWNGFIWKSSIDVETNGQLGVPNNG